jgi:hypothetical protein
MIFALCMCLCSAAQVPKFRQVVLDENFPGGYQVKVADVDGDGRPDVVALGETPAGEIAWYKNPSWKRYPISAGATKNNIDLAIHDIDGDGELEIAVASDFQLSDSISGGTISWLKRGKSLDEPWQVHRIDAEPTAHRARWADVDGDGKKELVCAPILGCGAKAPRYDQAPARLLLYRVPLANLEDAWPREVIDETLHVTHGLEVCDFDGDGRDELLTASFEGVHLFDLEAKGETARWRKSHLCPGNQERDDAKGSSEVSIGRLRGGKLFIATIEPWHGNEAVVYLPPATAKSPKISSSEKSGQSPEPWERHVLDDTLVQGHALSCADFNNDGSDEIIAGFRGGKGGIHLYRALDESGARWQKSVVEETGIAAQGFSIFDINPGDLSARGDGLPEFVAIGGATHNVHLYINVTGETGKAPKQNRP